MTTFDPEWTSEDMEWAMAWQSDADARCSGCGFPRDETFDPERATAYDAEPLVCHACQAKDRAANAYHQQDKPDTAGVYFRAFERGSR